MNKSTTIIIVMTVLLIVAGGYIGKEKFDSKITRDLTTTYEKGYNEGVAATVISLLQRTSTCQEVPIFAGNITKNLIDTACLKRNNNK